LAGNEALELTPGGSNFVPADGYLNAAAVTGNSYVGNELSRFATVSYRRR